MLFVNFWNKQVSGPSFDFLKPYPQEKVELCKVELDQASSLNGSMEHFVAVATKCSVSHSTIRNILTHAQKNRGDHVRHCCHRQRKLSLVASENYSRPLTKNLWRPIENWLPVCFKRSNLAKWVTIWHSQNHGSHFILPSTKNLKNWPNDGKLKCTALLARSRRFVRTKEFTLMKLQSIRTGPPKVVRARRGKKIHRVKPRWRKINTATGCVYPSKRASCIGIVRRKCWCQKSCLIRPKSVEKRSKIVICSDGID